MAVLTSRLIIELLDRVTGPARRISASVNSLTAASARNSARLAAMPGKMLGAAAAGYGLARGLKAPISAAIEFESAMADVRKVVDFATPEGFKKMGDDILALSKRIPITASGLAQITAEAGAAGMKEAELLQFTEMTAKLATAFDMTAESAGEAMAKIKTGLGYTVPQTSALADAMNLLSNNMAAKAPQIIEYMKRVGVAGKQYGFSATQTAAMGAAMIASGAEAEIAATSFRKVGMALTKGASVPKETAAAFKTLGLTSMQVTKSMQINAVGTFRDVLRRIGKLPAHLRPSIISQIFGDEARAIAPLIDNAKLLSDALGLVASETKYLGSAEQEFEARAKTTANAVQLFKNRLHVLSITIGSALLPAVDDIMERLNPLIERMSQFAKQNPVLTRTLIGAATALIGLRIAGLAAKWGLLWMWGGALAVAKGGLLGVAGAVKLVSGAFRLVSRMGRAARLAMMGATMLSAVGGGGIMSGLVAGLAGIGPAIVGVFAAIGTALASITAPIWGIAAAVVLAVAGLGLAIYKYWVPISNFVSGFASVIWNALSDLVSTIAGFGSEIAAAVGRWATEKAFDFAEWLGLDRATAEAAITQAIEGITAPLKAMKNWLVTIGSEIGEWFKNLFTQNQYSDEATAGFRTAGERAGQALVDAVKNSVNAMIEWFKSLPSRILSAVGSINLRSVIKWPSLPSFLGGSDDAPPAADSTIEGARAAGGPVRKGMNYLVGERGPELFRAPASGTIINTLDTVRAIKAQALAGAARQAGDGGTVINVGGIHVQAAPGQSTEAIAAAVERKFSEKLAALSRGAYSDGVN